MRSALFAAAFTLAFASAQEDISRHIVPLERALKTSADPGVVMYGIARTYAAAGQNAPALEWLRKIVALNQDFNPTGDDAFDAMRSTPEFRSLLAQIEKATPPVHRSRTAFTIADPDLIPEGMAYDPVGRRFFLGSMSTHKILEITSDGKWRDFAAEGLHQVLGMKADPATNMLWVADNGDNESAVLRYDLRSRKLVKRYAVPGTHTLNDLVVSPRGDVYITDTKTSVIYRIAGETVAEFLKGLEYPNGIALSDDGSKLFIAHFGDGISVVDVETRAVRALGRPRTVTLATIDGLYFHHGTLVAIQNFAVTHRIARFYLNAALDRVERFQVLERRNPIFDIPTTGAVAGNEFYYIANSQLRNLKDGKILSREKLRPVQILKVRLP